MLTAVRRVFLSLRLGAVALIVVLVYLSAAALSLVAAHVLIVVQQTPG